MLHPHPPFVPSYLLLSAKDVGKRKQLTTLNSTHSRFDQAQRAPKQMYDKQHGKAKGTISGQASVRTTQHNMTEETCSVILNPSRHCGRKLRTGGTHRHQHFENQPGQLPGGAGAEDMTNALVNCTGSRRRDQGCNHHSGSLTGGRRRGQG